MRLISIKIENFKSINKLEINDIENTLILVGKNNVGKTVILDALKVVFGKYIVQPYDFNKFNQKINIELNFKLEDGDLNNLYLLGKVSKFKKYKLWLEDFNKKIPSFKQNVVFMQCSIAKNGVVKFSDGVNKSNNYLKEILPEIYMFDNTRDLGELHDAILKFQGTDIIDNLCKDKCLFDNTKNCKKCFNCIGLINQKTPNELNIRETAKLMEYKLYNLNLKKYADRINYYMRKNGNIIYDIIYQNQFDYDKMFGVKTLFYNKDNHMLIPIENISQGIRSIYILSLLEAYSEEINKTSRIIVVDEPEMYLHPQLQKIASEILYRLSKKNQVIFSTHSPSMIYNFSTKQIRQVVLDTDYSTIVANTTNLNRILDDLGVTSNDLLNVDFVFIVEGKQDRSRLPLLLTKYYSEVSLENGNLQRISIISTNSCTNIKTYANLKFINQTFLKDKFLMIRDGDGKDPNRLKSDLCRYYEKRSEQDEYNLPRITPKNVLILKYYSFENYFLNPVIMAKIGVVPDEESFYTILYDKYNQYLYKLKSVQEMISKTGVNINSVEDIKNNLETIKIYVRGHNLFDIFYGQYRSNNEEINILKAYIDIAPREEFDDIIKAIDEFIYFENRKK